MKSRNANTPVGFMRGTLGPTLLLMLLVGCVTQVPPTDTASDSATTTAPATFVNRVWKVGSSNAVAPGQLYVFLSEGTLVIASTTGTPALGTWAQSGDSLTMVEEGISYPVDVLKLDANEFVIRMNSPGTPVDITLVPAE